MANILTAAEAANVLRTEETDPVMLEVLPLVDAYIQNATGHDWANDLVIHPLAKAAARMLLVRWYEDPGQMSAGIAPVFGLQSVLTQLKAEVLS